MVVLGAHGSWRFHFIFFFWHFPVLFFMSMFAASYTTVVRVIPSQRWNHSSRKLSGRLTKGLGCKKETNLQSSEYRCGIEWTCGSVAGVSDIMYDMLICISHDFCQIDMRKLGIGSLYYLIILENTDDTLKWLWDAAFLRRIKTVSYLCLE